MWNRFVKITTFWASKLLARLLPPRREPLPRQARLILVFSTIGIGDGLFDSAAIHSLKMGHPNAKLIVCAHRKRQAVALHNPSVDEVVPFGKSPFRQLRLLWRFRRDRPNLFLARLAGGKLRNHHSLVFGSLSAQGHSHRRGREPGKSERDGASVSRRHQSCWQDYARGNRSPASTHKNVTHDRHRNLAPRVRSRLSCRLSTPRFVPG